MATLKFPYLMHCPRCRAKLKIKSPDMVGKRMTCPSCQKKIDVVTPEEDGYVAYGVDAPPPPPKPKELTDDELFEIEEAKLKAQKEKNTKAFKYWFGMVLILVTLGGIGFVWYRIYQAYSDPNKKEAKEGEEVDWFSKIFKTD